MKPLAAKGGSPHFELHLVVSLVFVHLIPDVRSNHVFVQAYCGNLVASSPKVLSREILLARSELPRNPNRTFLLDVPNHVRQGILRQKAE